MFFSQRKWNSLSGKHSQRVLLPWSEFWIGIDGEVCRKLPDAWVLGRMQNLKKEAGEKSRVEMNPYVLSETNPIKPFKQDFIL